MFGHHRKVGFCLSILGTAHTYGYLVIILGQSGLQSTTTPCITHWYTLGHSFPTEHCIWMAGKRSLASGVLFSFHFLCFLLASLDWVWVGLAHGISLGWRLAKDSNSTIWVRCLEVIRHLMNHAMILFCCIMRSWIGLELVTHTGASAITGYPSLSLMGPFFFFFFFFLLWDQLAGWHPLHTGNRWLYDYDQIFWILCSNTNQPVTWPTPCGLDLTQLLTPNSTLVLSAF
ncbi:hypothetical protein V8F06_013772 [Rhypophila decipiens]